MGDVVQEIVVDASRETLFELLTVSSEHVRWMGTQAELDPRPGGAYSVLVAGEHRASGEFVEVTPNERVVFTFGWDAEGNPVPPGSTTVEITLHAEDGKTRVRLVHRGLPDDMEGPHVHGWEHYLTRLAQAAGGADPGTDTGPSGP